MLEEIKIGELFRFSMVAKSQFTLNQRVNLRHVHISKNVSNLPILEKNATENLDTLFAISIFVKKYIYLARME